jgi:DUF438 domain-containing protein
MSEVINNREYRQKVLKELISELHAGKTVDEVKEKFENVFDGVSAEEISQAEQALIAEGLPVHEVQRLCDVHAAVFKGSIEEIHKPSIDWDTPGHPVHTFKQENRAIERLMADIRKNISSQAESKEDLIKNFNKLAEIDLHYQKKENLFFPYLERCGITAPPKVMWGVDDEIRQQLKEIKSSIQEKEITQIKNDIKALLNKIDEMIFKEENILLPMLIEKLTQDEWKKIADETDDIGYCLIGNVPSWAPPVQKEARTAKQEISETGVINLPTGVLKIEELARMLDTLPIDITFVDKDDRVKYFSQSKDRIFTRTKAIIGRKVSNCHPPASVHIVEQLVEDFKTGKKDHEDFWIKMGDKYVYIRYFAVRNQSGEYMGTVEVTQDIKPIQEIKGEKRLVSE